MNVIYHLLNCICLSVRDCCSSKGCCCGFNCFLNLQSGAADLGAHGAQWSTHFLINWQFKHAFTRKRILKICQKCKLRTHFPAASVSPVYTKQTSRDLKNLSIEVLSTFLCSNLNQIIQSPWIMIQSEEDVRWSDWDRSSEKWIAPSNCCRLHRKR